MTATDRVVLIAYDGSRQAKRAVSIVSTFIHEERVILLTAWQAVQMQATRASSTVSYTHLTLPTIYSV